MTSFLAFFKKELMAGYRNGQFILFGILFALLGVISPVTVRLMPWLIDKLGDIAAKNGVDVEHITLNATTVWTHFFSNIWLGLFVFIFVFSGLFTKEYHAHTLILIFTHGIARFKVILAKFAWMALIWTVSYWLAAAVTYTGSAYYWDNSIVHHLFLANVLWWLFGIWIISLIVLISTISHSYIGVLLSALGILFGISVFSPWLDIASYLPTQLASSGALLSGTQGISSYSYSLISTLISGLLFLSLSILIMNRKEI